MVIGKGLNEGFLTTDEIHEIVLEGLNSLNLDGKRVLVIIPDATRTMPTPFLFELFGEVLQHRVKNLDYLIALGTHHPMNDSQLSKLGGKRVRDGKVGETRIFNHAWHKPETFAQVGTINGDEISQITGGLLSQDVPIRLNKLIFDYDQIIICGPVLPHEAAGFSGGNKYFFPGIAGPEIIYFIHWLGAVITNYKAIGTMMTPTRVVIDRAAEFVKLPTASFSFVGTHEGMAGLFFGTPKEAWQPAANLSALKYIIYKDKPFNQILSIMPEMYDDMWTTAKGMYKLEPVAADGGEIIIYAPHINEVSFTYGKLIDEVGYHCRDYYLGQWDRFKNYPRVVIAHSTLVRGLGTYDPHTGTETSRIQLTLATEIPAER